MSQFRKLKTRGRWSARDLFGSMRLEDRTVPATIDGRIYLDRDFTDTFTTPDTPLAGRTAYLDINNNGILDVNAAQTFNSVNVPLPITDLTTTESTLDVTGLTGFVTDVNVKLNITHTFDGDLDIFLIGPTGAKIDLSSDNGGAGDNFTDTVFDDQAAGSVTAGVAPFTGTFKPEQPLGTFNGIDANGQWKLQVFDDAGGDVGSLDSWSLEITTSPEPSAQAGPDGKYKINNVAVGTYTLRETPPLQNFVAIPAAGSYSVTIVSDTDVVSNQDFVERVVSSISGKVYNDLNLDGKLDAGEPGLGGWLAYLDTNNNGMLDGITAVPSTNVPVNILDLATVTSTLDVAGFSGTVGDVNVTIDLTHTWDSDLSIFLTGPGGQEVELTSANGGSGDNYTNTTFDDQAAVSITKGTAPFTGSFQPELPLNVFNGVDPNGTWTLKITDAVGGDVGKLLNWSVQLTSTTAEPNALTAADGIYTIAPVPDGTYKTTRVLQPGWLPTGAESYSVTLPPGGAVGGNDFPVAKSGSVTGVVYEDRNANGTKEATEPALAKVTIYADKNANGIFDAGEPTALSDGTGTYMFFTSELGVGTVKLALLADGTWNPGPEPAGGTHEVVIDTLFTKVTGKNFGALKANTVYGKFFEDLDTDGTFDAGEPPLAGWTAFLDVNGNNKFDSGYTDYASTDTPIDIPDPGEITSALAVTGFTGLVSDINVTVNITHTWVTDLDIFLVGPGGQEVELSTDNGGTGDNYTNTTFDDQASVSIVGQVAPFTGKFKPEQPLSLFNGSDPNGTWTLKVADDEAFDAGKLLNWTLSIRGADFDPSALSSADGTYAINDAPAGNYAVSRVIQPGFVGTGPASYPITMAAGVTVTGKDFSAAKAATVTGTVYEDSNFNATKDAGEPGLAGLTVYADANNNGSFDIGEPTAVSDAAGKYTFFSPDLGVGTHKLALAPSAVWSPGPEPAGGFHTVTLDTLFVASSVGGKNIGALKANAVYGKFFEDLDTDGAFDAGEPPLAGWTAFLDVNGNNKFDSGFTNYPSTDTPLDLPDLTTTPSFLTVAGFTGTATDVNVTINLTHTWVSDLNIFLVGPTGAKVELSTANGGAGLNYTNTVFDDQATVSIIGQTAPFTGKFRPETPLSALNGLDPNGLWALEITDTVGGDAGKLLNWSLDIRGADFDPSALSKADGTYAIADAPAGNYAVSRLIEVGFVGTGPASYPIVMAAGVTVTGKDFSAAKAGFATGLVYEDRNANGVRDIGEAALPNITIYSDTNASGGFDAGEPTAVTNAAGVYNFFSYELGVGTHKLGLAPSVAFAPGVEPVGGFHTITFDTLFTKVSGKNFGALKSNSVYGKFFEDLDTDGAFDAGEPPLAGWTAYLDTNANGKYDGDLAKLDANSTNVPLDIIGAADITSTLDVTGLAGAISDVNVTLEITHTWDSDLQISLISPAGTKVGLILNEGADGQNFVGTVLDDQAAVSIVGQPAPFTGTFKPEQPLSAFNGQAANGQWKLQVVDTFGFADDGVLTAWGLQITAGEPVAVTGTDGNYVITDAPAGSYDVGRVVQAGFIGTGPAVYPITMAAGTAFTGKDFSAARAGSVTGTVYEDRNGNGTKDAGETGVPGLTVYSDTNNSGTLDAGEPSFVTTASGSYTFLTTELGVGTHKLRLAPDANWVAGVEPVGGFQQITFDTQFSKVPGKNFGALKANAVYGKFFEDLDTDGTFDAGEPPLAGWRAYLDLNGNNQYDSGITTYPSTDTPLLLPDLATTTSTLAVAGFTGTATDVNVLINLTHTWDSDLEIFLTGPTGVKVALSTNNGGAGQNYTNTVFDDQAAVSITAGAPPFTGTFKPESPLSDLNGLDPNGSWTLEITDVVGGDSGKLLNWSLDIRGQVFDPSALSGADGNYVILDAPAGSYNATRIIQPGFIGTGPAAYPLTVAPGSVFTGKDFSAAKGGYVGGSVYEDRDNDGVRDSGEAGLANVTIFADLNNDGQFTAGEPTTLTGATGAYKFFDLGAGTFKIGLGDAVWGPGQSPAGGFHTTTLATPFTVVAGKDFGALRNGAVYGRVYEDLDVSGTFTDGEPPLAGWTAFLDLDANGQFDSGYTDFAATGLPIDIGLAASTTSTLTVAGFTGTATDVNVTIDLTHTWDSDLSIFLIGPGGQKVELSSANGGLDDNYTNTTFDDQAAVSITAGKAPFTGTFKPEQPLSAFNGTDPNGTWTLEVVDSFLGADTGTLKGWSVSIRGTNFEPSAVSGADGIYVIENVPSGPATVSRLLQPGFVGSGPASYPMTLTAGGPAVTGKDFGALRGNAVYGKFFEDLDTDGTFDAGEPPLVGWTAFLDLDANGKFDAGYTDTAATGLPIDLPDLKTTTSTLAVAGFTGTATDVNVTINLTHTFTGDLNIFLTSPTGAKVELTSGNGGGGDNYTNTVFDDQAATSIKTGVAPFTGTFQPETPLSVLNGTDPNGTWTLEITDAVGGDVGKLLNWSVSIRGENYDRSAVSGKDGRYTILDAPNGTYDVTRIIQAGFTGTGPASYPVVMTTGAAVLGKDFSAAKSGAVTGTVYEDRNFDGTRDLPIETAVGNVTIYADANLNGQFDAGEPTTLTAADGTYSLFDLGVGTHKIGVVPGAFAASGKQPAGGFYTVNLASPFTIVGTRDFGVLKADAIYGRVYEDLDGSLSFTPSDAALAGKTVYLDADNNGKLDGITTVSSPNVPVAIADLKTVTSTLDVAGFVGTVADVDVTINLTHTWVSDLNIFLVGPTGAKVELTSGNGGAGDNYANTTFDDQAATSIKTGVAPFTGAFQPETPLNVLNGLSPNGTWTLEITDVVGGDVGSLLSWSVKITEAKAETTAVTGADGVYVLAGVPAGAFAVRADVPGYKTYVPASGVQAGTLATGEFAAGRDFGLLRGNAVYGKVYQDADLSGTFTAGELPLSGWTTYLDLNSNSQLDGVSTYTAADTPVFIQDLKTVSSFINVGGFAGTVVDVDVKVNITHTWDSNVDMFLIGPGGAKIELSTDNGADGDDFFNTIFDDQAAVSITAGVPPYIGSYQPEQPLSTFNGLDPNGIWELQIFDDGIPDPGTILGWSITFRTAAAEPTALSGPDGLYVITGAPNGSYGVSRVLEPGFAGSGPASYPVTMTTDAASVGNNFGAIRGDAVYGRFYEDANVNGQFDAGEAPLAGWKAYADLNGNGQFDSKVSDIASADVPLAIPDNNTVFSKLEVSSLTGVVSDIDVTINLTHSYTFDLGIYLISPSGTRVALSTNNGGAGQNYTNTTFDDQAATSIVGPAAPFTGSFKPEEPLSRFANEKPNGVWRLQIDDYLFVPTTGELLDWSIKITSGEQSAVSGPDGKYVLLGLDTGTFDVTRVIEPGFAGSGPATYPVTMTPGLALVGRDFGAIRGNSVYGKFYDDANKNAVFDAGEAPLAGWRAYLDANGNGKYDANIAKASYASFDVPLPIPDLVTVNSVTEVSGLAGAITDINVTLDLTHTWDADLNIFLIAPDGTKVELSTGNGGAGDNYTNTTFDDSAAVSITAGVPPFTGSFKPEQPLAAFNGANPNGQWKLQIFDAVTTDTGTLNSWSIEITTGELSAISNADGLYNIQNVPVGSHTVRRELQPGYVPTQPAAGQYNIFMNPGDAITGKDFGQYLPPPTFQAEVRVNGFAVGDPAGLQRSMVTSYVIAFNEAPTFPNGLAAAFKLQRVSGAGAPVDVGMNLVQGGNSVTITFTSEIETPQNSLVDGKYQLTIFSDNVLGASGKLDGDGDGTAGGDLVLNTHRLFGDSDGNAKVNFDDFLAFRGALGSLPSDSNYKSYFDYNFAGGVQFDDYLVFRTRFGTGL